MRPMILILTVVLLSGTAHASSAGPGDLLSRHIEWLGGAEAFRSLRTLRLTGRIQVAGLEGDISVVAVRGVGSRTEYDLGVIRGTEVVSLADSWEINASGQVETMGEDKAEVGRQALAEMFGAYLLGEAQAEVRETGPEERDGRTWEGLAVTYPNGDSRVLLLDPQDGSLAWSRSTEDTQESWTRATDWRIVGGVRFPFRQETTFEIAMRNQTVAWTEIAVDEPVDPVLFHRPEAGAQPVRILAAGGSTDWIPMELYLDRYLYLRGTINGMETDIVLDSGAGMTVLDAATAERVGLESAGALPAVGTGGAAEAGIVNDVQIRIGDLELTGLTAAVLDLADLNRRLGRDLAVILGKEVFNNVVVDIDYPNGRIAFRDPARWSYRGPGNSVRLIAAEDSQKQIEMQVGDLEPAVFDLDTGNGGDLVLFAEYAGRHGIPPEGRPVSESSGGGVGGRTTSRVSTLESVTFAGFTLHDVPVAIPTAETGSFHTTRFAGNVGAAVFTRFRMIFDYPADRLIVEPGPEWDTRPFRRNTVGIQADLEEGVLDVYFVAPGSPASAAGIRAGDRIVAIDGEVVDPGYWQDQYRWMFRPSGQSLELRLADGTVHRLLCREYY